MTGPTVFLIAIGILVFFMLAVQVALYRGRAEGYRDAYRQIGSNAANDGFGFGCLKVFAAIGFIAFAGLCLYLGMALSNGAS
ncbi:MAG: hypothetical protein JXA09_11255 [Anaerolineae bacterium]|nr:hypothetical protein [Anaerolineae bacterium]